MVTHYNLALFGLIGLLCVLSMGYLLRNAKERFQESGITNGQLIVGSQAEADIILKDLPLNGQVLIANTKPGLLDSSDDEEDMADTTTGNQDEGSNDPDPEDGPAEDDPEDDPGDERASARTKKGWQHPKHPKYIDDGSPWLMYPALNLMDLQAPTQPPPTTRSPNATTALPRTTTTSTAPPMKTTSPSPATSYAPLANFAIRLASPQPQPQPQSQSMSVFRDQQQSSVIAGPTTTTTTTPLPSSSPSTSSSPTPPSNAQMQPDTLPETPNFEGTEVFLDNGIMRVGFDLERGAALYYIASKSDNDYKMINLINDFDCGRMIQQSFYGQQDGSVWPFPSGPKVWRWNPVQAGNYLNVPSKIKAWTNQKKNCFTSFTTPRHWVTGDVLDEVQLKQDVCLQGDVIRITFKMTYSGTVSHLRIDQELPAIYMWKGISRLVLYDGDNPWRNDELTIVDPPISVDVIPGQSYARENWAAYVSKEHGWGMGVLFPHTNKISYYLVSSSANGPEACAYLAPIVALEITPGLQVEYDVFIVTGKIEEIREKIYGLKNKYSMFE